jgi:acetolactate synthase small subunit
MEVLLEPEETATLIDALRTYSSDLRMEIVDTDNPAYKRPLKHQREVLDAIVEKLKTATTAEEARSALPSGGSVNDNTERVSLRIVAVW